MFGMESQKNKKAAAFVFELEKEFKNPKMQKEMREKVESRMQKIKDFLRNGESREDFDKFGALLYGYASLLKIMARFGSK